MYFTQFTASRLNYNEVTNVMITVSLMTCILHKSAKHKPNIIHSPNLILHFEYPLRHFCKVIFMWLKKMLVFYIIRYIPR